MSFWIFTLIFWSTRPSADWNSPEKEWLTTCRPANIITCWYLLFGLLCFHVKGSEFERQPHWAGGRVIAKVVWFKTMKMMFFENEIVQTGPEDSLMLFSCSNSTSFSVVYISSVDVGEVCCSFLKISKLCNWQGLKSALIITNLGMFGVPPYSELSLLFFLLQCIRC